MTDLGTAWERAERALPNDWRIVQLRRHFLDPNEGLWTAVAALRFVDEIEGGGFDYRASVQGTGKGPVEALVDLAAELGKLPTMDGAA